MSERGVVITTTYVGAMPNQVEGTINGEHFYFRARHGEWSLDLAGKQIAEGQGEMLGLWQEIPGYWQAEDALAFCRTQIGKYLNSINERCTHNKLLTQHCAECARI